MNLLKTASHIYAEHGEAGVRRWEDRLTPDQKLALSAEIDQFGAGLKDIAAIAALIVGEINEEIARLKRRQR